MTEHPYWTAACAYAAWYALTRALLLLLVGARQERISDMSPVRLLLVPILGEAAVAGLGLAVCAGFLLMAGERLAKRKAP